MKRFEKIETLKRKWKTDTNIATENETDVIENNIENIPEKTEDRWKVWRKRKMDKPIENFENPEETTVTEKDVVIIYQTDRLIKRAKLSNSEVSQVEHKANPISHHHHHRLLSWRSLE